MTETEQAPNPMLARIRALLAKAESTEFPDEAEAYTAKAQQLMAQHGIDEAALLITNPAANPIADRVIHIPAPYAMGKLGLLRRVADAMGVKHVRIRNRGADEELHLFGLTSDLDLAEMLFTSLLLQAARLMAQDRRTSVAARQRPKSWTRDWQDGYANRVGVRLAAMYRQAEVNRPDVGGVSTALVHVRKDELVSAAVAATYPKLVSQRSTRQIGVGYGHGDAAGRRADLGGTRIGNSDGRALSR
jgi:hypothetical protein